jgi:RHS repeat-associated protein
LQLRSRAFATRAVSTGQQKYNYYLCNEKVICLTGRTMSYKYIIAYKDKRFNKVEQISEGSYELNFTYGLDRARKKTVLKENGLPVLQKYFFGSYEIREDLQSGNSYEYHFLPGGAIYRITNGHTGEMLYTYSDYLGSITHVTDENGNVLHRQSFGAWGRERDPDTYENFPSSAGQGNLYTNDRGYTGHEMLPQFGIINMNGRLYDPITGRMLSPDPYIQMPDYSQNFNRYAYVLNNPFKFTDPSGDSFLLAAAVIAGAYFGGAGINGGEYNPIEWDWNNSETYFGIVGGAIVGGFTYGLGSTLTTAGVPATLNLMINSTISSLAMNQVTLGQTPVVTSFGIASYNHTTEEWGWLGKDGNTWYENLGYGVGALANLSDIATIVDGQINLEQRRIDEMQNYPPNGELEPASQGKNLDGLTYSGPQNNGKYHMAYTKSGDYYLGPIDYPNFVDANGFRHDLYKGHLLGKPGFKNLITTKIGNSADWRFCYENYYLGTKNLFTSPRLSLIAYKNATFFLISKTVLYYGYNYFSNVGAIK